MQKGIATLVLAAAVFGAAPASAARFTASYTSLTVFGDSLVDAGNVFRLTGGTYPGMADGYFMGRFTNGYDYTDLLSQSLFGSPTRASLGGGANYAFGGARILDSGGPVPSLGQQLLTFQARLGTGRADENGLYVLNFGGNDQFNADTAALTYADPEAYIEEAARVYAGGVQTLNDRGARNILITGFPVADALAAAGNAALIRELAALKLDGRTTVFRYDYLNAFERIGANPTAYGVAPITQTGTCQSGGQAAIDNGCAGYATLDGVHPIATIQRAVFNDINAQFGLTNLQAVPEPATWGMMLLGFAILGAAARRPRIRVRYRPA